MNTPTFNSQRLDYLDAVRAFALLLGIVFHAGLAFFPVFIGWAVMDVSTSAVVSNFALISHAFRMELFFLIAGFFSHHTFHSKGAREFVRSRALRIALPFVIAWFLLRPLLVSAWIMGMESMRGEIAIGKALMAGFTSLGSQPLSLYFTGTHLWFLYYLVMISAGVLVLRGCIGLHKPLHAILTRLADTITAWLCHSRLAILVVALPTAACLWFMERWGVDTPDKSLLPHVPVTLVYTGFFLSGWLLHRQHAFMADFSRLGWEKCGLGLLAIIATMLLNRFSMALGHPHYTLLKAGFVLSYAIMMWSLASLSIGLFRRCWDRPSKRVRYLADASYWLYLTHLPIVIWLQISLAELPWHWAIKWASIVVMTMAISLVLYDLFVRNTLIGAILNGKRKPRGLFAFGKATDLTTRVVPGRINPDRN